MFDLMEQLHPVERTLSGTDSVTVNDRLKIVADGVDLLNEKVPNGKKWQAVIKVSIEESQS